MGAVHSFNDLEVWKKSVDLAEAFYRATANWPKEEKYGLTQQLRRAGASVPANIAEGSERNGTREFLHFLGIARGSLAEARTFLILAHRLTYLDGAVFADLQQKAEEVSRMLSGLSKSLQTKLERTDH